MLWKSLSAKIRNKRHPYGKRKIFMSENSTMTVIFAVVCGKKSGFNIGGE
jgi:hypothetical protein